ncbi:MAG: hypothetical protein KGY99_03795 [Phycisphaerae bacterium]|nr:hypothetical protein [Phycisphaerae bacterium]
MPPAVSLLVCRGTTCDAGRGDRVTQILEGLRAAGHAYYAVDDLCALAAAGDPMLPALGLGDELTVIACDTETVRRLFTEAGGNWDDVRFDVLDVKTATPRQILSHVGAA